MLDMTTAKRLLKKRFKSKSYSSDMPVDYEVLIVGAGIAGISMACHLQQQRLQKIHQGFFNNKNAKQKKHLKYNNSQRFLIVEKREGLGGTWDLFTYPGIRSDSDALTFGYSFRPWLDHKMLAKGADIKSYIADTAREFKVLEHIRYQHEVQQLSWSSSSQQWTATIKKSC